MVCPKCRIVCTFYVSFCLSVCLFLIIQWLRTQIVFKNYFIEVYLIYNIVLISTVQQSDSVIPIHIFLFIFFFIMVYHRMPNIVPCAIQWDPVVYPFCIYQFASASPKLLIHPFSTTSPLATTSLFSVCESVSVLQISSFVSYFRFYI